MPLALPTQKTDLAILEDTRAMARHAANYAILANRIVSTLLAMDDATLTGWLQGHAAEVNTFLTRHATLGAGLNMANETLTATLTEVGDLPQIDQVDVRPFADKLAAKGLVIDMATLTVTRA